MKLKFSLIAAMLAVSSLALTGCGGGSDSEPTNANPGPTTPVASPATLSIIETQAGTGTVVAANGNLLKVHYTGYFYSATAANNKGAQFETSYGKPPLEFRLGVNRLITGFEQGVTGMKVGAKRTVLIPSGMAYGSTGKDNIPPNAGLVFDMELVSIQ